MFFGGLWNVHQERFKPENETKKEADFIQNVLPVEPPAQILDVPCGTGRLAIELAERGFECTGLDQMQPLLETGKRIAAEKSLTVHWRQGDMRDLPWRNEFDAVVSFWWSFGYFDDSGNLDFLKSAHRALKKGGVLVLETHLMETLLPDFRERSWLWEGDLLVLEEMKYDAPEGRMEIDLTFIQGAKKESKSASIRLYTYRELSQLMAEAGFSDLKASGTLGQEPFALGGRSFYLIGSKR